MKQPSRWLAGVALTLVAAQLCACAQVAKDDKNAARAEAAAVERVKGRDVKLVILSRAAAERLAIRTAPVRRIRIHTHRGVTVREVVPYSAVLYGANGRAFVYTSPRPLTYLRAPIRLSDIRGNGAIISAGPPAGTAVVTVGVPELYGTEFGVTE